MRAVAGGPVSALAALLLATTVGCRSNPPSDVTVVVDGQIQTMSARVICTTFPDGTLLIYASPSSWDATKRVRILLATKNRLVVHAAGFRFPASRGFTSDSREMIATKVDDTYTIIGRMPPDDGEIAWRQVKIEVSCSGYTPPSGDINQQPSLGSP